MNLIKSIKKAIVDFKAGEAELKLQQAKVEKVTFQDMCYIELNNLFLDVERGKVKMSVHVGNTLRTLVGMAYDQNDSMIDWWMAEFMKLPNWLDY